MAEIFGLNDNYRFCEVEMAGGVLVVMLVGVVVGTIVGSVFLRAAISTYNSIFAKKNPELRVQEPQLIKSFLITFGVSMVASVIGGIMQTVGLTLLSDSGVREFAEILFKNNPVLVLQLVSLLTSFVACVFLLKFLLPTRFSSAFGVASIFLLITIAVGGVIAAVASAVLR